MSLYSRYAQGDVTKTKFKLTSQNITEYRDQANEMNDELRWIKTLLSVRDKLNDPEKQDDILYTPEYLRRRLDKLEKMRTIDETTSKYIEIKAALDKTNDEISIVFPKAIDKDEGNNPEIQNRMSELNDKRKELENDLDSVFGQKYEKLKKNMPKVYYMILESVDMNMVNSCFNKMISVLAQNLSPDEAANQLMDESISRYKLPKTMYDPIRTKPRSKKGKK